jgi:hypothetical protein
MQDARKNELFPDFNDAVLGAGDNVPVAGLAQGQARNPVKMACNLRKKSLNIDFFLLIFKSVKIKYVSGKFRTRTFLLQALQSFF